MADHANARSVVRKIIITAVVGAISFPITQFIFPSLAGQFAMAVGFGSVVLLVQFLADFDKRLGRVETTQVGSVAEIREVVNEGFTKVNTTSELLTQVESAGFKTVVTEVMLQSARIKSDDPPLVREFAQAEIRRMAWFLRGLAEQEANYDGEDQDWLLGLTRLATRSIDAISLPEVDASGNSFHSFWASNLGRHYLDMQRVAVRRGVRVRRVFVTEHDDMANDPVLQRICHTQSNLGIELRILCPSDVPREIRGSLFDFVLFDNTISYEVTSAPHIDRGEVPTILGTRLTLRSERVNERVERYKNIWESAIQWPYSPDVRPTAADLMEESGRRE